MDRLNGTVAVPTGARGLGRAAALRMAVAAKFATGSEPAADGGDTAR